MVIILELYEDEDFEEGIKICDELKGPLFVPEVNHPRTKQSRN